MSATYQLLHSDGVHLRQPLNPECSTEQSNMNRAPTRRKDGSTDVAHALLKFELFEEVGR